MKYVANPVVVEAKRITEVATLSPGPGVACWCEDGSKMVPTLAMMSRYIPFPGDYVVTQEDGYVYLNPKDVFERKYRPQDSIGATGEYPRGKMSEDDEGEIRLAIGHNGTEVIIQFGTPVTWLGMPKSNAKEFGEKVLKAANELPEIQ